jgi:hypothetical protein
MNRPLPMFMSENGNTHNTILQMQNSTQIFAYYGDENTFATGESVIKSEIFSH